VKQGERLDGYEYDNDRGLHACSLEGAVNTLQRLLPLTPKLCLDDWQLDEADTRLCLTIVWSDIRKVRNELADAPLSAGAIT